MGLRTVDLSVKYLEWPTAAARAAGRLCVNKNGDWDRHVRWGSRRFLKDIRSRDGAAPNGRSIYCETATSLTAPDWSPLAEGIGSGTIVEGEGPLVYQSNTEDKWYLWIDELSGGRRYVPFETGDLTGGRWTPAPDFRLPRDPCHGTVLRVTGEEYERLRTALG